MSATVDRKLSADAEWNADVSRRAATLLLAWLDNDADTVVDVLGEAHPHDASVARDSRSGGSNHSTESAGIAPEQRTP
jgi:hypothetical protein